MNDSDLDSTVNNIVEYAHLSEEKARKTLKGDGTMLDMNFFPNHSKHISFGKEGIA